MNKLEKLTDRINSIKSVNASNNDSTIVIDFNGRASLEIGLTNNAYKVLNFSNPVFYKLPVFTPFDDVETLVNSIKSISTGFVRSYTHPSKVKKMLVELETEKVVYTTNYLYLYDDLEPVERYKNISAASIKRLKELNVLVKEKTGRDSNRLLINKYLGSVLNKKLRKFEIGDKK